MTFTDEQKTLLAAKLDPANVKQRQQGGGQVSYVEGWHAIAEANRIFGFDAWARETVLLQETNRDLVTLKGKSGGTYEQWRIGYIAKVRITVDGIIREGTGFGSGMGRPESIGDAVEGAIKEAETDAMKRALMTFGNPFGLALYDKKRENVGCNDPKPDTAKKDSGKPANCVEPQTIRVDVTDSGADWGKWATRYEKSIDYAPTLEWLNKHVELNRVPFRNFKKSEGQRASLIETVIDNKRGLFAQAPDERAA